MSITKGGRPLDRPCYTERRDKFRGVSLDQGSSQKLTLLPSNYKQTSTMHLADFLLICFQRPFPHSCIPTSYNLLLVNHVISNLLSLIVILLVVDCTMRRLGFEVVFFFVEVNLEILG